MAFKRLERRPQPAHAREETLGFAGVDTLVEERGREVREQVPDAARDDVGLRFGSVRADGQRLARARRVRGEQIACGSKERMLGRCLILFRSPADEIGGEQMQFAGFAIGCGERVAGPSAPPGGSSQRGRLLAKA